MVSAESWTAQHSIDQAAHYASLQKQHSATSLSSAAHGHARRDDDR